MVTSAPPPACLGASLALVSSQAQTFVAVDGALIPVEGANGMVFSGLFGSPRSLAVSFFEQPGIIADDEADYLTFITPVPRNF